MRKIHYSDSQPELTKVVGQMMSLIDSDKHIKEATSSAISRQMLADLKPDKDHFLAHLIAVGDGEFYSFNRNGDFFGQDWNIKKAGTFVTHGHFFREHRNRHPDQAIGIVKAAVHNPEMHRIEVAVWGHKKKAEEEYEKAKKGETLSFSMSCRVPWDECSCCQKRASRSSDYCDHLKYRMGQWIPEYEKFAYAINYDPTYFDISRVGRPADRIAHHLEFDVGMDKAASAGALFSDVAAELEGVCVPDSVSLFSSLAKQAAYRDLSECEHFMGVFEKAAGERATYARAVAASAWNGRELADSELDEVRKLRPETFFYQMAKRGCVLPFASFVSYITGDTVSSVKASAEFQAAREKIPGMFSSLEKSAGVSRLEDLFDASNLFSGEMDSGLSPVNLGVIDGLREDFSVCPDAVRTRMLKRAHGQEGPAAPVLDTEKVAIGSRMSSMVDAYALYKVSACCNMKSFLGDNFIDDAKRLLIITQQ